MCRWVLRRHASDTAYATFQHEASSATYGFLATCDKLRHVPVSTPASVGELIRQRRKARGWDQIQLGQALGIDRTYVSRWETDKITPGEKHAVGLARELGGEPSEYRGLSGEPRRLRDLVDELMARVERLERKVDSSG